jgi:hypothetical protein
MTEATIETVTSEVADHSTAKFVVSLKPSFLGGRYGPSRTTKVSRVGRRLSAGRWPEPFGDRRWVFAVVLFNSKSSKLGVRALVRFCRGGKQN